MLSNTKTAIKSILEIDQTIDPKQIVAAIRVLEGKSSDALVAPDPIPRVLSREQVAELTKRDAKTIDQWGRTGKLKRIYLDGGKRSIGYSEESVRRVLGSGSCPSEK